MLTDVREDPLPKLLSDWKPAQYSKDHAVALLDLVHETMLTLDLAQAMYHPSTDQTSQAQAAAKSRARVSTGKHCRIVRAVELIHSFQSF
jgi:hypothetical protein